MMLKQATMIPKGSAMFFAYALKRAYGFLKQTSVACITYSVLQYVLIVGLFA